MANTKIPSELVAINAIQGTLIADNAITAVHVAQNQIHSVQLAINSVTATQIADGTITSAKIADGTIVTADIADGQITTGKIADSSVTTGKIAAGTILGGDIANNAILTQHIDDNQITADQIADNAVGLGQLASLSRGSIIYGDSAGNPAYLAAGSSGHVLTSDGTDISWTADTDLFLASSGGTITGDLTISEATPTLKFTDTDNNYDATIAGLSGSLVLTADSGAEFGTETIQFHTGGSSTLTLDASQNATFAGTVTVAQNILSTSGAPLVLSAAGGGSNIELYANGTAFIDATSTSFRGTNGSGTGNISAGTISGTLSYVGSGSFPVTPNTNANDLVVFGTGSHGISILSGTSSDGNIFFGDSGGDVRAKIQYSHNGDYMTIMSPGLFQLLASGDMTIDAAGDINLDADGGDIQLKDGGVATGRLGLENGDLNIASMRSNYDIVFKGNDSDTGIMTAMKLDMSDAGTAHFENNVYVNSSIYVGDDVRLSSDSNGELGVGYGQTATNNRFTVYNNTAAAFRVLPNGNVGIGPTAPLGKLHVRDGSAQSGISHTYIYDASAISIEATEPSLQLMAEDSGTHGGSLLWRYGNNAFAAIANPTTDAIDFTYGVSTANDFQVHSGTNMSSYKKIMSIGGDGNVGIGTDDPKNILDLGVATTGRGITWTNYSNVFSEYSNASAWISSNFYGNSGASGYKVGSTGTFGAAAIRVHGTGGGSNGGIIQFFTDASASKTADNAFTPTERMKINEHGKVFIGTNSTVDDCLDIGNTNRDSAVNMSKASGGAVTREVLRFNGPFRAGVATGGHHTYIHGGGTTYLEVEDSGRVLATNTTTAAGPVYTFQGDDNTGLYSPAADTVELATAGVRGLSVQPDSSILVGATMGSVQATQKSGKIAGKATPNVMEWDLPRSNTSYQHGDSVSGFSSAYGLSYGLNGDSNANKWKLGEGPSGCTEWLWAGISAGSTGASGGWGTGTISIDNNYSYLFVLWIKRVSSANTGTYYHGTGGVVDASGNSLGNPYMTICGTGTLPLNVWCVDIQPIHAWHMTANVQMGNQGLFRTDTGARLQQHSGQFSGVNIFRAGSSSNQSHNISHRTYLYYPTASDGTELHWACPRLYRIDGSQPSAAELISGEMNAAVAGMS